MIVIAVLLGLLIVATVTDVSRHKIYNWTTYPGIAAGLVLNFGDAGWTGLQDALAGFFACGFLMLVCFVLFNIGGGDVKLIAMMGACLGLERGIEALLWTFVLGAIMGTVLLIWQIGFVRILVKTIEHLKFVFKARSWVPLTPAEREPLKRWLFLAPSALAAVVLVVTDAARRIDNLF
jgi:prepilin peptidase CpaA